MAVVYKGLDETLQRPVAIKVLRPDYSCDTDFVRRFRREAQAAANLFHPNIVNVYDIGEERGMHYIVMEYVEGKTLKEVIREKGKLDPTEAARITLQICDALEKAHSSGIVHRDIKPHNILIDSSGRVKVTDFGIARAVSNSTLTKAGTMMGSAHYVSPEQAQGEPADERSDIYSLGITFYEMLTGKVPFDAEEPLGLALKHVEEEPAPPSEVDPGVPEDLDPIVMKCLEKDPRLRPQSARELANVLGSWLAGPGKERRKGEGFLARRDGRWKTSGSNRALGPVTAALIAAAILLGAGLVGLRWFLGWLRVPTVQVPNVVGLEVSKAEVVLAERGLEALVIGERYDDIVAFGKICSQDPKPEEVVRKGRQVQLTLSKGPERVEVPDVRGIPFREADLALKARALDFGNVTYRHSETFERDIVIDQDPPPKSLVARGSLVHLVLSGGPEPRPILLKSFLGMQAEDAKKAIAELGLTLGEVMEEESQQFPSGTVIDQSPAPGSPLKQGDKVDLVVSKGGSLFNFEEVTISVPRVGTKPIAVKVVVEDTRGAVTVYEQNHQPGDIFKLSVQWRGREAMLRVYYNGELGAERPLKSR